MKRFAYLLLSTTMLLFACGDTDDPLADNLSDCPTNLACTEIFVSLHFSPKDANGSPLMLDSFYSQNLDNGNTYSIQNADLTQQNSYIVVTDNALSEINQNGTTLRFFGLIGNQIVVQQDFEVGHDCCHVTPISGPFEE